MKLYGSVTSPFVRHCRIACLQEGVDHELVLTDYVASAKNSPTQKVPFMKDGSIELTDSSSILHYIRHKSNRGFLLSTEEAELFFLADTGIDTAVNIFLMENDGVIDTPYLVRQKKRFESLMQHLDTKMINWSGAWNDGVIRLACLLEWGLFRKRFAIDSYKNLSALFQKMEGEMVFKETKPH